MKVITTQPIEGVESDTEVTVPKERGEWLVANGYAKLPDAKDEMFGHLTTSTEAKLDPTLAENRPAPTPAFKQHETDTPKGEPDGTANASAKQTNTLPPNTPEEQRK